MDELDKHSYDQFLVVPWVSGVAPPMWFASDVMAVEYAKGVARARPGEAIAILRVVKIARAEEPPLPLVVVEDLHEEASDAR